LERRLAAPVGSARKACSQYGEKDTAMDLQLAGKRALVTGSSSGIGSEIARKLAAEGIGVVVHGRNAERTQAVVRQIEDAGGRAAIARGDLMTEDGKAAVIDATGRAFGGVDILGQQRRGGASSVAWFETTGEEWTDSYRQNTLPAVALAQAFVPGMRERGWGRCIQIVDR
jgi:3-oxoacyl-[acyl-carrier protein] reductase